MMRRVRRELIAVLIVVAACALGVGCGASGITKERALAYSHAVNLRPRDLPGWQSVTRERLWHANKAQAAMAVCLGLPFFSDVLALSPLLARGHENVGSWVGVPLGVLPSAQIRAAGAAREIAVLESARGRSCSLGYLRATIAPRHEASLSITSLPNPLSGLDGAVAYRFQVRGTYTTVETRTGDETSTNATIGPGPQTLPPHTRVHRVPFTFYEDLDLLALPTTGTLVELFAGDYSRPFPAQTERRALALLHDRAEAQAL
jgi:hypothetical protein